jgi:RNA-binding protein YhbY
MQKQMAYGVSILDILKLDAKDMEKAKAILPYQAEPVLKIIEEQMISLCGLKKDLINIINNPLIKRDAPKVKIIKRCLRKTNGMIKAYSDILKLLDGLRLE